MELHVLHKHGWSISALAREFGQALAAAGITDVDPVHLLLSIVGMSFFPFVAVEENLIDREFIETRKQHVLHLLLGGIKQ